MNEVFSQERKRGKIQWWRSGLSEITLSCFLEALVERREN